MQPPVSPSAILLELVSMTHRGRFGGELGPLDAVFRRGETTLILGGAGTGKSSLASLLSGNMIPSRGKVHRTGRVAPLIGQSGGLGETASLERDLGLRAAAYNLRTRPFCQSIAALLGDAQLLQRPYDALPTDKKQLINRGASLLVPADIYIADGPLMPQGPDQADPLAEVLDMRRRNAAVIWIHGAPGSVTAAGADQHLLLSGGKLVSCSGPLHLLDAFEAAGNRVPPGVFKAAAKLSAA